MVKPINNNIVNVLLSYFESSNLKYKKWFKITLYIIIPLLFAINVLGYLYYSMLQSKTIIETNETKNETKNEKGKVIKIKVKAVEVFYKSNEKNESRWHSYFELKRSLDKWYEK